MKTVFKIEGQPVGKGRPRFTKSGHAYTPDKTRDYENAIAWAYKAAGGKLCGGYVSISVKAFYKIPKSATKANAEMMRKGFMRPVVKPDIDNVLKAVLDGLNKIAYSDDTQVIAGSFEKFYSDNPGVIVEVAEIE